MKSEISENPVSDDAIISVIETELRGLLVQDPRVEERDTLAHCDWHELLRLCQQYYYSGCSLLATSISLKLCDEHYDQSLLKDLEAYKKIITHAQQDGEDHSFDGYMRSRRFFTGAPVREGDSVTDLGLPIHTANALYKVGIESGDQLKMMSKEQLCSIPSLGKNSMLAIEEYKKRRDSNSR